MNDRAPIPSPTRVRDVLSGQVLLLTCPHCETPVRLPAGRLQSLTRDYVKLANVAANHICGKCHAIGAEIIIEQENEDETVPITRVTNGLTATLA